MDKIKKAEWTRNYRKTWKGMIVNMYDSQKQRCKNKPHCLSYALQEFKDWCERSRKLKSMYKAWVDCGYFSKLKPSIDRINPKKGYELANIQALTWEDNNKKGARDKIALLGRKVAQLDMDGKRIKLFRSIGEASTTLEINKANIWMALNDKRPSAGGFKWRYIK